MMSVLNYTNWSKLLGVKLPIKGVNVTSAKLADGSVVYYYYTKRKGGVRFWTSPKKLRWDTPLPVEFVRAYNEAMDETPEAEGDIAQFITDYLSSDSMPPSQARRKEIDYYQKIIRDQFGKASAQAVQHPRFRKILRKWRQERFGHSPRQADIAIGVFSLILQFALDDGLIDVNRAAGMKKLYTAPDDKAPIPADHVEMFMNGAKPHVADALTLALFTGLRVSDLAAVSWSHDKGDHIWIKTKKRQRFARIPLTQDARRFIDALKARQVARHGMQLTMLVGQKGRPMLPKTITRMISERFKEVELPHTAHRARNTFATMLLKSGFSHEETALIMGWSMKDVEEMIRIYVDADQVVSAAIARMEKKDD